MDYNFTDIKKKKVINIADGKDLGKITDFIVSYPDGKIKSIIVPGKKNAFFTGCELIINFSCIERIGDDAVLVCLCKEKNECCANDFAE
ncbi:MAG: YlmC/YmxH family sporulation protein [Clostridia bacterium]|nr:YlmC/YmxH family sporulation protein [Clostridia bacterium]